MGRTASLWAGAAALAFGATGALAQGGGGTLRIGVAQGLVALDPHTSSLYSDVRVLQQIYRGLLTTDPETLAPVGDMAESWEVSEDGLVWTVRLREGLTFHDGTALTASDVVYSLNRIRDEATGATLRSDLEPVESVEAVDDLTVRIALARPYGVLAAVLATPVWAAIVPEEGGDLVAEPVGSGPFRFVGQIERTSISLERFEDFHDPERPFLDAVEFVVVPDESARVAALLSGQVDLLDAVSLPLAGQVEAAPGVSLLAYESAWVDEFGMNTQRPPFDDVRVRRAIAMAIDKEAVAQAATMGRGAVAHTMVSASSIPVEVTPLPHDPEAARALLAEAGVEDLSFEFAPCGGTAFPHMMRAAEVIAENLRAVGIDARNVTLEAGVWGQRVVTDRDYDAFVCGLVNGVDPDQKTFRYFSREGVYNFSGFEPSDELQALLERGREETDPAVRSEIYSEAWQILVDEAPWVPLYVVPGLMALSDRVEGFRTTPDSDLVLTDVRLAD